MLAIGGFSAAGIVAILLIISLVLPGLPLDSLFGSSGSGDIFETSAAEAPRAETSAAEAPKVETTAQSIAPPPAPPNPILGGVDIYYNCPDGCDDLVTQLNSIAQEFEDDGKIVGVTPKLNMQSKLLLVGASDNKAMETFDESQIRAFIATNTAQSP